MRILLSLPLLFSIAELVFAIVVSLLLLLICCCLSWVKKHRKKKWHEIVLNKLTSYFCTNSNVSHFPTAAFWYIYSCSNPLAFVQSWPKWPESLDSFHPLQWVKIEFYISFSKIRKLNHYDKNCFYYRPSYAHCLTVWATCNQIYLNVSSCWRRIYSSTW